MLSTGRKAGDDKAPVLRRIHGDPRVLRQVHGEIRVQITMNPARNRHERGAHCSTIAATRDSAPRLGAATPTTTRAACDLKSAPVPPEAGTSGRRVSISDSIIDTLRPENDDAGTGVVGTARNCRFTAYLS
ncbi:MULTISPECIES: hypothetical protein [Brevibacterium]|uniref:hypothetical protein n=1 Tax=Brevibacterium TaxID=1696 RepID=UPI0031D96D07